MGIPLSNPAPSNLPVDFSQDTIVPPRTLGSFGGTITTPRSGGANLPNPTPAGCYNFGAGSATLGDSDRAVGFVSNALAAGSGNLYGSFRNNTGTPLTGLLISYNVEKYRNGSNPAGFRYQLFYSFDGSSWTNAGPDFFTGFAADTNNNGFATAPGATVPVTNKILNVSVANGANIFLAWNYSVTSGFNTDNAQALAIDNISVLALNGVATNPSGVGAANPISVAATSTTLLTVNVTPGTNPPSTAHTVTADLSTIGGNASQQFFDDGTHGDVTAGDRVFSFNATVALGTNGGIKSLPFTINETSPFTRSATGAISLGVLAATNPSGVGTATPDSVLTGEVSTLTVTITPGTNPTSTGIAVSADLSSIGGSANQQFIDEGNNVFTYVATVSPLTTAGLKSIPFSITDGQARSASGSISLNVEQPPPPVDHLVISQVYGGGGDSGATFTNDYVEIFNPTGLSFNLAGWSLQYASATGSSWTSKQPLGGTIAPGEYFLVSLASSGANGAPLPVSANISSNIQMDATSGKLALVSNSSSLSGSCPNGSDPDIVDFVGYGSGANCFEGGASAPAPSSVSALFRKLNGAQDTNQNGDDFQTGLPNPRRTAPIVELGPWVTVTDPIENGLDAPYDATISVEFSEPVDVAGSWFDITCASTGQHNSATVAAYNGSQGFHITPNTGFQFGEQCTVTVFHSNVQDQDADDSSPNTDTLFADYSWTFTVVSAGAPAPQPPSVHLTLGNPSNAVADLQQGDNYLMEKPSFALSYNQDKGTPNWVSWHLENAWTGNLPRTDTFRADPAVSPDWYRVQASDYSASGYARGHMIPDTDRNNPASIPLNQETFLMSNVAPLAADSQGPWDGFDSYLRSLLPANEIYIVAGPAGAATTIANGHVTVPTHTWKVALVLPAGENDLSRVNAATRTIAVIIPNLNGGNPDWHSYLTTVDAVEALTGYDFFTNIPQNVENAIEAGINGTNPPGTEDQSAITAEDVPLQIVLNAASPLATPALSYTIVSQPAHGGLSGSGPDFTYTPALNFHGSDSFTFRVNDGGAQDSNTSTMNITVTEVNDTPAANNQSVNTNSNTPLAIALTGSDVETATENLVFEVSVNPAHGSLSGSGANLTYTPHTNYSGPDSFEFTVRDAGDGASAALTSAAATVSITINDTVAPSISAPANVTVNTGPNATTCGTVVTDAQLGTANASDNAGNVSVDRSGVPSGNVFPVGTTTITYTATDNAGNSNAATQTVTVIDNTAPTLSAPAPTSVNADSTGHATIPDVVAGTTASDNCGPVTVTQSPLAGTIVGTGTHTITLTATDAAGNTRTATTTLTVNIVNSGGLTFSLSVSPETVKRGKQAKIDIAYANTSAARLSVSFTVRYTSPCGSFVLDNVGPVPINAGADKSANVPFHVPKTACTGQYTLTLEAYVEGVLVGTDTAVLTVTP